MSGPQEDERSWTRAKARWAAKAAETALQGVVERSYVVGSVRRGEDRVKDVELLVEPREASASLFAGLAGKAETDAVRRALEKLGELEKAGDRYVQVRRSDGLKLDVFLCHPPAEWGTLLAIRTGPAELSQRAVTRIRARGWRVRHGAVWQPAEEEPVDEGAEVRQDDEGRGWRKVPTPTEKEFFDAARLQTVPPTRRWKGVAELEPERE